MSATGGRRRALVARLIAAGCVAADAEADEMLSAALDGSVPESWLERREHGEPLAWITGSTTFCGHTIAVDPGLYVPRWQSESLARRAAAALPRHHGRAVDLCTGSGAIAVHLAAAAPGASIVGTDIDLSSVRCARRNGVTSIVADLGDPLRSAAFDVVTIVAPYVPTDDLGFLPADVRRYEPRLALDGGSDGLDLVRGAASAASRLLRAGGSFFAEVGGSQEPGARDALTDLGFGEIEPWYDDEGDLRGIAARATEPTDRG